MIDDTFHLYRGNGSRLRERGATFPPFDFDDQDQAAVYLADDDLRDAVNVALALGQPLLLTGEPGTGKTQLAASVARELELPPPLVFPVKTTSSARDLFYHYDALRHFRDAQRPRDTSVASHEDLDPENYISYVALGLAILHSVDPAEEKKLPPGFCHERRTRSVVCIDEVDKAPRDLPNDVLNELEKMNFTVYETRRSYSAEPAYRPIVILTSNSEKNLPDAFLRRCVYYHIPFPDSERLRLIVERRFGLDHPFSPAMLAGAITHFEKLRDLGLKKKPATAEFLSWLRVLMRFEIDLGDVRRLPAEQREALRFSYSILAKTQEDLELLQSGQQELARA